MRPVSTFWWCWRIAANNGSSAALPDVFWLPSIASMRRMLRRGCSAMIAGCSGTAGSAPVERLVVSLMTPLPSAWGRV